MKPFIVPDYDVVDLEAKPIFNQLKKMTGKVPNLYATIGYSANALQSYLAFTQAQAKGSFHAKDREAIFLLVSQMNGCPYCLAAHTVSAKKTGWTELETVQIRAGIFPEKKWQVLHSVIQSIIDLKGELSDEMLENFYSLGYKQAAIIDLMALVSVMSFTNYVYRLTRIPIDYPAAPALP